MIGIQMQTSLSDRLDIEKRINRVFVIDDDPEIRRVLRTTLGINGFHVDTFASAVRFLASGGAALVGCVLTDVWMPGMTGLELQKILHEGGAHVAIVVMAGSGAVDIAVRAMKAGAVDFLEKPFSEVVLIESIARALELVSQRESLSLLVTKARDHIALLTKREKEVFDLIVIGDSNKVVAQELKISPRTVEVHRARLIRKMGATSLAELVHMSVAGIGADPQAYQIVRKASSPGS
jgi:two-component system response regulator FixJ